MCPLPPSQSRAHIFKKEKISRHLARTLQCDHFSPISIVTESTAFTIIKKYLGAPVRLTRSGYLCLSSEELQRYGV